MKKLLPFTLAVTVLALLAGPVAVYAKGTPDGETPANEGVCDGLKAEGVTKGLYGLCVAFCEAQDCEATLDEATGEVTFDESCRPSNPRLLENYNKRKADTDPPMPCLNVKQRECPCWTEIELVTLAPSSTTACGANATGAILGGLDEQCPAPAEPAAEIALTTTAGAGFLCSYIEGCPDARVRRLVAISEEEWSICYASIVAECAARGF